jgi:hypothetical protein
VTDGFNLLEFGGIRVHTARRGICTDHGAGHSIVPEMYVGRYKASREGDVAFLHSFDATLYWVCTMK